MIQRKKKLLLRRSKEKSFFVTHDFHNFCYSRQVR